MGLAFLSGANPFLFFLERKESKRKSSADHAFALFKAVYAILLHKTDGSYVNRPFFRFKQDVRESVFSQIDRLSRSVFCFFSSRKEIVPLLFFLEEKTVSLRGKRRPSDGRTQAHPALSSVGIPQRVCLPPPPCLCPCPPRLRASFPVQADHAKENQLRNSHSLSLPPFLPTCNTKRTVRM